MVVISYIPNQCQKMGSGEKIVIYMSGDDKKRCNRPYFVLSRWQL